MNKQGLKIGNVIKQRNGHFGIMISEDIISGKDGYSLTKRLSDDLTHIEKSKYDVIAVYEINEPKSTKDYLKGKGIRCIWEREDV